MSEHTGELAPHGVGETPTSPSPPGPAVGEQPTATPETTAAAPAPAKVNLDEIEDFRKWKASMDRQVAALRTQAQQATQEAREAQDRLAEARLADASPGERETFLKGQIDRLKGEQQRMMDEAQRVGSLQQRAVEVLQAAGLDFNTPGLEMPEEVSEAGLQKLYLSVLDLVAQRRQARQAQEQQQAQVAEREAHLQEVHASGAAQVSLGTGAPPKRDLAAEYQAELAELRKMRPQNRARQIHVLRQKYRALGYEPLERLKD